MSKNSAQNPFFGPNFNLILREQQLPYLSSSLPFLEKQQGLSAIDRAQLPHFRDICISIAWRLLCSTTHVIQVWTVILTKFKNLKTSKSRPKHNPSSKLPINTRIQPYLKRERRIFFAAAHTLISINIFSKRFHLSLSFDLRRDSSFECV